MDISGCVSSDYAEYDVKTPVSKLRGAFDDQDVHVIVVTNGGHFDGVVSRAQLLSSHHPPDETVMNVMQDPPIVQRTEDVRETARLMVENELKLLPVFDGEQFVGVVTAAGLLGMVRENLDALTVADVYTRDLVSVGPDDTLGEVIHLLREQKITRVPVLSEGKPEGLVSVYDVVDFVVRAPDREQGGGTTDSGGEDASGSHEGFNSDQGFGERAGEQDRLLDLPVRDVMSTPVLTVAAEDALGDAVERMFDDDLSSLVVVDGDGTATGIVTKTDALQSLTWTDEEHIPVQIFDVGLLDDLTREEIAERVEEIDAKYEAMDVLEVNVTLHEHDEQLRGVPLLLVTVRLFTDEGLFSGSGEGYGAKAAFNEAAEVVEENALQKKGRDASHHSQKDSPERRRELDQLVSWWLGA